VTIDGSLLTVVDGPVPRDQGRRGDRDPHRVAGIPDPRLGPPRLAGEMGRPAVIDTRNLLDPDVVRRAVPAVVTVYELV